MSGHVTLGVLGWDTRWAEVWAAHHGSAADRVPARVVLEHQHIDRVHTGSDEVLARVTGRVRHTLGSREAFPAVGDWIALKPATPNEDMGRIVDVLPRRGRFVRKAAGTAAEAQVVAANVDVVFLVSGLDHDFNVRRIERYLIAALEGGAAPVIVLPDGGLLIDTPGMRELQLRDVSTGLNEAFEDIAAFGADCRFRDCTHDTEPDCGVKAAVEAGRLSADRLANYQRLRKEVVAKPVEEADIKAAAERRRDARTATKALRKLYASRGR